MKRLAMAFGLVACSASSEPVGPVARSAGVAAELAGVPAELVLAVAVEEGGIKLRAHRDVSADDHVPVAGLLELRHGRLDTLALGAQLLATSEDALRIDTDLGTRAGAQVLASLGASHGATVDLASWRGALEALSGLADRDAHDYASRVLAILRAGGAFVGRDGEMIRIAAHPEISVDETLENVALLAPTAADYPGAIWFTTSCVNKCTIGRPLGNASVDKIVIHDTEGGWDGSVATLQNDGGKSVHYIIDADGSRVGQFRPETDTTWHAGNYFYNETSVGIEHVGVASDPAGYSDGLYATSKLLVKSIRTRWSVPLDRTHIVGHYQIPNGALLAESSPPCTQTLDGCETSASYGGADNHRDPGYNWQWCQYMQSLGGHCTCNDAYPLWNCTTDKAEAVRCVNGAVEIQTCAGGCVSQPLGTNDVCHTEGGSTTPDAGVAGPDSGSGNPETPTGHGGGCQTGGSPGVLLGLGVLLVIARRRHRRS